MAQKLGLAQYFVFKRPQGIDGRIIYGKQIGGTLDSNTGMFYAGESVLISRTSYEQVIDSKNNAIKEVSINTTITGTTPSVLATGKMSFKNAELIPLDGQPWILHSVHFGVREALKASQPLTIKLGEDNVKICKVLTHELDIKMV